VATVMRLNAQEKRANERSILEVLLKSEESVYL